MKPKRDNPSYQTGTFYWATGVVPKKEVYEARMFFAGKIALRRETQ